MPQEEKATKHSDPEKFRSRDFMTTSFSLAFLYSFILLESFQSMWTLHFIDNIDHPHPVVAFSSQVKDLSVYSYVRPQTSIP